MNFSIEDFGIHRDDQLQEGWLKLETVLSIYIDMIERGKVVALSQQTIQELNEAPLVDPATGACRLRQIFKPWAMLPYSPSELEETLSTWDLLVAEISKRIPGHVEDEQGTSQYGLVDAAHLDAAEVPPGFAREFLSRARRPNFAFIAPGIRLSTAEEFVAQPYRKVVGPDFGPDFRWPIRLFMMEHASQFSAAKTDWPDSLQLSRMPCGLFLNFCSTQRPCPFEDDTLVVFPFDKLACYPDDSSPGVWKMEKTYVYGMQHGTQLLAIIENMYLCVGRGRWQVNEHGVAGGISWFEEASVAELEEWYSIPVGPGRFC